MGKIKGVLQGSYLTLKKVLLIIVILEAVDLLIDIILCLTVVSYDNTDVSAGNIVTLFLVIMPFIVNIYLFKRLIALGASRIDYYRGKIISYISAAAIFAVFNIIWLYLEKNIFIGIMNRYNIISIFGWDRHGLVGMFFYQLAAFLLIIGLLDLIAVCFYSKKGLVLDLFIAGCLSLVLSLTSLRIGLLKVFYQTIFNPNIFIGFVLTILATGFIYLLSWNFNKIREIK